ncbi:MAG: hypothetical protein J3R72DRAFT_494046 [Linnemannia gamsii]|nr:MAG: hypothetical protein J3R72DRAFT_494046 [Linnemannia gamsii]
MSFKDGRFTRDLSVHWVMALEAVNLAVAAATSQECASRELGDVDSIDGLRFKKPAPCVYFGGLEALKELEYHFAPLGSSSNESRSSRSHRSKQIPGVDIGRLLEVCPTIESLMVNDAYFHIPTSQYHYYDETNNGDGSNTSRDMRTANATLRTLSMYRDLSVNHVLLLLSLFPNLSSLTLKSIGQPPPPPPSSNHKTRREKPSRHLPNLLELTYTTKFPATLQAAADQVLKNMNTLGKSSMDFTSQETKVLTKFRRYQTEHHGVYDQLSRLVRLKHLDLGFEGHFPQADQGEYDQLIITYIND